MCNFCKKEQCTVNAQQCPELETTVCKNCHKTGHTPKKCPALIVEKLQKLFLANANNMNVPIGLVLADLDVLRKTVGTE
jgi:hypothetical protein